MTFMGDSLNVGIYSVSHCEQEQAHGDTETYPKIKAPTDELI